VTDESQKATRRQALLVSAGLIGGVTALALRERNARTESEDEVTTPMPPSQTATGGRLPVVFVPHGGGPWPFVQTRFGDRAEQDELRSYLASLAALPLVPPRALLVVSAHWEEPVFTVMSGKSPPMLYDYSGFPPESYQITWPAPGDPALAERVRSLLAHAGFESSSDEARGFDHGTFVPLKLAYPGADVPCVQLSLRRGLDPDEHLKLGRALSPLRDEGVFIVGSGMTFHNLRAFGPQSREPAERFDRWLRETAVLPAAERNERLRRWAEAPDARRAHPREEHLLPLMVVAGAALEDKASIPYNGTYAGLRLSAYQFG
jgi:aromatic ring-opening dioxygenase catalytic subunit (LigB family)